MRAVKLIYIYILIKLESKIHSVIAEYLIRPFIFLLVKDGLPSMVYFGSNFAFKFKKVYKEAKRII